MSSSSQESREIHTFQPPIIPFAIHAELPLTTLSALKTLTIKIVFIAHRWAPIIPPNTLA